MPGIGPAPSGAMVMEDVGDLQPRAAHRPRVRLRVSASPRAAARAGRADWSHCGSWCWRRGCTGRGVELGMAEQHLDDADIGILFQQVCSEAVPQRVRRHSLLDAGGLGCRVDGAVELTGRERLDRVAARKQPAPRQQYAAAPAFYRGDSMASRSLRPLPCSTRNSMRSESMSPTLSATTSETRSPAP